MLEGAEMRVLEGARRMLAAFKPQLLIETHDFLGSECSGLHEACLELLSELGYARLEHRRPADGAGTIYAYPPSS